ncbi:hypothetical protein D7Y13_33040 [Corallococcus praedator]|uniref:Pilus formation protein N-terminal domain-containing protein n=2 Tax=Myxococcaceae TaxID=31 RepID=A0ABX9Q848_9BACT|nr:hypothetical protein D7X75_30755 [Corallococcus sp. CA031C]RKH94553.1 hypothetical protein D7Y13_33040 [Corallococcus praedator]
MTRDFGDVGCARMRRWGSSCVHRRHLKGHTMASRIAALTLGALLFACVPVGAKEPSKATKESAKKVAQEKVDAPPADETLTLRKGAKRSLLVPGLSRVALGDPTIADVVTTGAEAVEISGLAEGTTTLLTWDSAGKRRAYRIEVGR